MADQLDLFADWPPICDPDTPSAARGDLAKELCVSPVDGLPLTNGAAELEQFGVLVNGYDLVRWCVSREAADHSLEYALTQQDLHGALLVSRTVFVGPWAEVK